MKPGSNDLTRRLAKSPFVEGVRQVEGFSDSQGTRYEALQYELTGELLFLAYSAAGSRQIARCDLPADVVRR